MTHIYIWGQAIERSTTTPSHSEFGSFAIIRFDARLVGYYFVTLTYVYLGGPSKADMVYSDGIMFISSHAHLTLALCRKNETKKHDRKRNIWIILAEWNTLGSIDDSWRFPREVGQKQS